VIEPSGESGGAGVGSPISVGSVEFQSSIDVGSIDVASIVDAGNVVFQSSIDVGSVEIGLSVDSGAGSSTTNARLWL
jgi:hypothetical protein